MLMDGGWKVSLHIALANGHRRVVDILLERGADAMDRSWLGIALSQAFFQKDSSVLQRLIKLIDENSIEKSEFTKVFHDYFWYRFGSLDRLQAVLSLLLSWD